MQGTPLKTTVALGTRQWICHHVAIDGAHRGTSTLLLVCHTDYMTMAEEGIID